MPDSDQRSTITEKINSTVSSIHSSEPVHTFVIISSASINNC